MSNTTSMVLKRVGFGALTILVITVIVFAGVEALPGDLAEAILGQQATPETIAAFRDELKLDLPPHVRYFTWLSAFAKGDLGRSLATGDQVWDLIGWRFSNTLLLGSAAAMITVPLAVLLGILSALYSGGWFDRLISTSTLTTISFPEFFVAYILILLFSVKAALFPSVSMITEEMTLAQKLHAIMLPCLTLMLVVMAHIIRMTRAAIMNVMNSRFIEMARLKGVSRARIIVRHALPNALSPIINVIILNLAWLVVGVVIIEVVFAYPGLGQLMVDSVSKRDIPVVQAAGIIFAVTYVGLNLLADVLSILCNPKLRSPK